MRLRAGAAAIMLAAALAGCRPSDPPAHNEAEGVSEAGLAVVALTVRSGSKTHQFRAEVAATEAEQARGLMFRQSLAPDAAMVFPFAPPRPASFWMKDTFIPLDVIFVRPDGTIAFIEVNALPHSLQPIAVEEPLAGVVEVAGGRSAQLGISEGDRISWPGRPAI